MKSPDDYFADWESHFFGYGYGTGEDHTIPALKAFFATMTPNEPYHYEALEKACGPLGAWLLINALCHADIISYGTSPRFGFLTPEGTALKAYIDATSVERMTEVIAEYDDYCFPDHCNCHGDACHNPFWKEASQRSRNY